MINIDKYAINKIICNTKILPNTKYKLTPKQIANKIPNDGEI